MQEFWIYFEMGRQHIADLNGYDHILFVLALCLRYSFQHWKKLLILITAFTIGHSIALALSTLRVVNVNTDWVEFLIPVTIVFTALSNVWQKDTEVKSRFPPIYFVTLLFGLIHGLGFSTLLKSHMGKDVSIVSQLLAFNIGLELGQLLIVAAVLLLSWLSLSVFRMTRRDFVVLFSGAVFGIAFIMALERWPIKKERAPINIGSIKTHLDHFIIPYNKLPII